jgi:hypothetical protein
MGAEELSSLASFAYIFFFSGGVDAWFFSSGILKGNKVGAFPFHHPFHLS